MLQFQWNALRRGDHVLVHDASDADLGLTAGVVTLVDVHPAGHDVSVRLMAGTASTRVVQPGRFAVHLDSVDDGGDCWRCGDNRP
jgi:hypothetical protein